MGTKHEYLTVGQFAREAKVGEAWLRDMTRAGVLEDVRNSNNHRIFCRADIPKVQALLASRTKNIQPRAVKSHV